MTYPSLTAAIRRVAATYACHPFPPAVDTPAWLALEAEIDDALTACDPEVATRAIERWERFAARALREPNQ